MPIVRTAILGAAVPVLTGRGASAGAVIELPLVSHVSGMAGEERGAEPPFPKLPRESVAPARSAPETAGGIVCSFLRQTSSPDWSSLSVLRSKVRAG